MYSLLDSRLRDCRRIFMRGYEVPVRIGVFDFEKIRAQRVFVNVDLFVPLSVSTPVNDQLSEIIDYSIIRNTLSERAARGHINLQETLCDDVARELLKLDFVRAVRVSSEKPDAYADCEGIGVEVFLFKEP